MTWLDQAAAAAALELFGVEELTEEEKLANQRTVALPSKIIIVTNPTGEAAPNVGTQEEK